MDESPPAETSPPPTQAPAQVHTGSPTDFLKGVVGKRVIVRLTSGVDYRGASKQLDRYSLFTRLLGVLSCLDGYMNIALEQTEEHTNGRITNRYGDSFIRGNNGTFSLPSTYLLVDQAIVLYISAAEAL